MKGQGVLKKSCKEEKIKETKEKIWAEGKGGKSRVPPVLTQG